MIYPAKMRNLKTWLPMAVMLVTALPALRAEGDYYRKLLHIIITGGERRSCVQRFLDIRGSFRKIVVLLIVIL